ncbi:MAG: peroxiredoxin [Jatrophihabitans sp.]
MRAGDVVPDFQLLDQDGVQRSLSGLLADGPVVLFFYPAAMTTGCTKEACHFRDVAAEYKAAGAQRVGISMDTVEKQKQFSDTHSFDYPLLADTDGAVAETFGIKRGKFGAKLGAPVKRWTFVIGRDSKIIKTINSETKMDVHADEALAALK